MMKKCLFIILLLVCVNALNAANFSEKSTLSLGAYGNFGAAMGGGVEFGFALYSTDLVQVRNAVSAEMRALKLQKEKYDSSALIFHEKLMAGILMGSSALSHIGFAYFRPYLFISGGFGLVATKDTAMDEKPFYYEIQGGIGHEFITMSGHSVFFELGGGMGKLTHDLPEQIDNPTLGRTKFLLGYRWQF